jgi:hypothetical protein
VTKLFGDPDEVSRHLDPPGRTPGLRGGDGAPLRRWLPPDRHTTAIEEGVAWSVGYRIDVDDRWRTIQGDVTELVAGRERRLVIESDRAGRWTVDCASTATGSSSTIRGWPRGTADRGLRALERFGHDRHPIGE